MGFRAAVTRLARLEARHIGARHLVPEGLRRVLRAALAGAAPGTPRARRHIPDALGVEGLLRELQRQGVAYVVLRWFEDLPRLAPGEDIDLLVADADLPRIGALLDAGGRGLVPCDLYTASGLPGTDWRGMPYYPPALARRMLARAETRRGLVRVPCREDHFVSLAYHAAYHKGLASGLPTEIPGLRPARRPDHDYAAVLAALAAELRPAGLRAITLDALDEALAERGWRPPPETLACLAERNEWLRRRLAA